MEMGLNIEEEEEGRVRILRLEGRIDVTSSAILEKRMMELIDQGYLFLLFDCAKVAYLSSAGLRLILSMTKKLKASDGMLAFCNLREEVTEIIKMAGFERIIHIFSDETEAMETMQK